jgi:tRNA A-37 threonylcarbamoyl transferase component Bud32
MTPGLTINVRYERLLRDAGLKTPDDFLAIPGAVFSGHPDRHVARVSIAGAGATVHAILKREHRPIWKERMVNWWRGHGLVSKSLREAQLVWRATHVGAPGPELIAAGQNRLGQSFILLRAEADAIDGRRYLARLAGTSRHSFLRLLGRRLAQFHQSGFLHPDLCSKHILISQTSGRLVFLDWQRSRQVHNPSRRSRQRDLAALDVTLDLRAIGTRDRLRLLTAYLAQIGTPRRQLKAWAQAIRKRSKRMANRDRYRRMDNEPADNALVYRLHGDALCVTEPFKTQFGPEVLDWLKEEVARPISAGSSIKAAHEVRTGGRLALQRSSYRSLTLALNWVLRRALITPELREAGKQVRETPQAALAFGQRRINPWRSEAFLLTRQEPDHEENRRGNCTLL